MFLVIHRDTWEGLVIVTNHLGKAKTFENSDLAYHYAKEFDLCPFEVVEVTI